MRNVRIGIDMLSNSCSNSLIKHDIQATFTADGWTVTSPDLVSWMELKKGSQELLYCEPSRISGTVKEEEIDLILRNLGAIARIQVNNVDVAPDAEPPDAAYYRPLMKAYRKELSEDLLLAFTTGGESEYINEKKPLLDICVSHSPFINTRLCVVSTEQIMREEFLSLVNKKKILSHKSGDSIVFRTAKNCEIQPSANICRAVKKLDACYAQSGSSRQAASFKLMAGVLRMESCIQARKWATVTDKAVNCIQEGTRCSTFAEARALWIRYAEGFATAA